MTIELKTANFSINICYSPRIAYTNFILGAANLPNWKKLIGRPTE